MISDVVFSAKYNLLGTERFRYVCEILEKSQMYVWASLSMLVAGPHWDCEIGSYFAGPSSRAIGFSASSRA
jgi:hypothetical protein